MQVLGLEILWEALKHFSTITNPLSEGKTSFSANGCKVLNHGDCIFLRGQTLQQIIHVEVSVDRFDHF